MGNLLHRSLRVSPEIASTASGLIIRSEDGRDVIDGSGGAAVACLGHGNRRVIDAIREQLDKVSYAHTVFFTNRPAEELAHHLLAGEPGGLSSAYFVSSGSEAVESAIKLARQYQIEIGQPRRTNFVGRKLSYHGNTLGALAAGGHVDRRAPYEPLLSPSFSHVSPCFAYHYQMDTETEAQYATRLATELEDEFQRLGPDTVAAFIAETVVGATTGCVPAVRGYFAAVREVCDRYGILLILDEVMCGMGRTGTRHAWEQGGTAPDIQVIAKGLGGGYQPIGGILISRKIVEAMRLGSGLHKHGHTYSAHPIACAAALAVQRVIADDGLLDNVATRGTQLGERLKAVLGQHPQVGDIRGRGLFWAVEFVRDRDARVPFDTGLSVNGLVKDAVFSAGLACYPCSGTIDGKLGDHVILAPPYNVSEAEIEMIVERFKTGVEAALHIATKRNLI